MARTPRRLHLFDVLFGLFVALVLSEIGLRVADVPAKMPPPPDAPTVTFDEALGWRFLPDLSNVGNNLMLHTDGEGYRVPAGGAAPPRDVSSVLVVGGSYAQGASLPFEEGLAGRLAAAPRVPWPVVNAGVGAYGTAQTLVRVREELAGRHVAAVVYLRIDAHEGRDAFADPRVLAPGSWFPGTRPAFAVTGPDAVEWLAAPRPLPDRMARLVQLLRRALGLGGVGDPAALQRALVLTLAREVEASGAHFVLLDWPREHGAPKPVPELAYQTVLADADAPPAWATWTAPDDPDHPGAEAHAHAADLVVRHLAGRGVLDAAP